MTLTAAVRGGGKGWRGGRAPGKTLQSTGVLLFSMQTRVMEEKEEEAEEEEEAEAEEEEEEDQGEQGGEWEEEMRMECRKEGLPWRREMGRT